MKKFTLPIVIVLLLVINSVLPACISEPIAIPIADITSTYQKALDVSVKINGYKCSGSAVVFNNDKYTYIWGCAHVVKSSQNIKKVYDARRGKQVIRITYKDITISRLLVQDGRKVGEILYLGKVIRFSDREDISLVKLYATGQFKNNTAFAKNIPLQGTSVWCVGSPMGSQGHTSITKGVISAVGRLRSNFEHNEEKGITYDQIAATAAPGNSGGGVFLDSNGHCIGLVTEYLYDFSRTPGLICIVPARRIRTFAERNNCVYALDNNARVPDNEVVITDDDIELPPAEPRQIIFRFSLQP